MIKTGFSIIELLVVLAIIGVIAAIAVPSYKTYQYKVKVQRAYDQAYEILSSGVATMQKSGSWNSGSKPIIFNGVQLSPYNGWNPVRIGDLQYFVVQSTGASGGKGYAVFACVNGLDGMPGYLPLAAGGPVSNGNQCIAVAARETAAGALQYTCGTQDGTTYAGGILKEYRPSNCTCDNIQNWSTGLNYANCPT